MKGRKTIFHWLLLIAATILFANSSFALSEPQPETPKWLLSAVTLNGKGMSFAEGVTALGTQLKHTIVADGTPIPAAVDWDLHDSAKGALDKFCERYDYDWTVNKRGAVLLRKRFFVPAELPQMHLAEMQQTSRDVLAALTILPSDPDQIHEIALEKSIYTSLNTDQLAFLRAKVDKVALPYGNVLRLEQLSPEQRPLVSSLVVSHAIGRHAENWRKINAALNALPLSVLRCEIAPGADPTSGLSVLLEYRNGREHLPLLEPKPKVVIK